MHVTWLEEELDDRRSDHREERSEACWTTVDRTENTG
jgi:hypothetical protein